MPLAISQPELGAPPSVLRRRPWTRADCDMLESTGAFEGQGYELIEGELIDKMGMDPPHSAVLMLILDWMVGIFGARRVRPQLQLDVSPEDNPTSKPQPDVCATTLQFPHYRARDPGPSEVLLLVEVADTTLDFDTTTKAGLYARAGIADYWVLDVNKSRIIVHREPVGGEYRSLTVYESEEPVSPLAAPEASFRWTDMETE